MIFGGHFPLGCPDLVQPSRASKSLSRPQFLGPKHQQRTMLVLTTTLIVA